MNYKAYVVKEIEKGYVGTLEEVAKPETIENHVLIKVYYSSLNYKDALSATGNKGVTRNYPHTPGIDAVGIVEKSRSSQFKDGDAVIVTGNDLGMNTNGGFGDYIHVPAEWVVKLPESMTMKESMIYGTAGFTAALSVYKLQQFVQPEDGPVLVTGASGGVGSIAVRLLSKLNYHVIAVSNKADFYNELKMFGAKEIITREEASDESSRPMISGRWQGIIDTVGGNMLTSVIKALKLNGAVTCCGNLRGHEFTTSIYPFILRGITLMGITSASSSLDLRKEIWRLLSDEWKIEHLHHATEETSLEDIDDYIQKILKGQLKGRTVIKIK